MYDALTIADEILKIAKRRDASLTPMQLMKLVYIAHGWALAVLNRDLFGNRIEAWKYGPVIPDLYHATKHHGRAKIPANEIDETSQSAIDEETLLFLEDVYNKYGQLSGIALSNLTHKPGTPWDQIYRDGVMKLEIPDELIKTHYAEKLSAHRRTAA